MRDEGNARTNRRHGRTWRTAARLSGGALLAAAILGATLPGAGSEISAASGAAAQQSAKSFPKYQWMAGSSVAYRIAYVSRANADLRKLFEGQQSAPPPGSNLAYSLQASLQGVMRVTTMRTSASKTQVILLFQDPAVQLVVNGQPQDAQAREVERELKRGFLVEMTPQGRPVAVYLQESASKFSQDFTLTLIGMLQIVLPKTAPAGGQAWTVREEDRNGAYLARYRIEKEAAGTAEGLLGLRKSKLRYLPENAAGAEPVMPGRTTAQKVVTPRMSFFAQFDPLNGEMATLQGTEAEETEIQGKKVAHAETLLSLRRESRRNATAEELEVLFRLTDHVRASSPALALFTPKSLAEIEASVQRTELGEATIKDLLAQLAAMPGKVEDKEKQQADELPLYLKFKALIYLHPEDCPELGKALAAAPEESATYRVLSAALGAVGHREAQRALIQAIRAQAEDAHALPELIAALGTVPAPTDEAEKTMRELAATAKNPNVSGGALLAMGSMARNLAQKEPQRSEALVSSLLQLGSEAGATEETIQHVLQALGNTASPGALPFLKQCLGSATPGVRAAALDGMRALNLPEVDPLLLTALAADAEPMVRREAVFALGFRQPSRASVEAQSKAFAAESDDKVRAGILSNLGKMYAQFPEVREVIATAAEKDESEYVRKTAAGLLQVLSPAAPAKPEGKP